MDDYDTTDLWDLDCELLALYEARVNREDGFNDRNFDTFGASLGPPAVTRLSLVRWCCLCLLASPIPIA